MMQRTPAWLIIIVALACGAWAAIDIAQAPQAAVVEAVEAVGMTVADMERSVRFYTDVLSFDKVSDVEVTGSAYEHLQGVFGVRMRVVRLVER
jgi:hypothetical protein